jgi:hypothetical protein
LKQNGISKKMNLQKTVENTVHGLASINLKLFVNVTLSIYKIFDLSLNRRTNFYKGFKKDTVTIVVMNLY